MGKKIQDAQKFITNEKNRTTVIAGIAGFVGAIAAIAGVAMATKRGKKRK